MPKRRSNPSNPNSSSVLQMLLDCQTQGGWPAEALNQMIEAAKADPKLCKATDKLYSSHRYPEKTILWTKHRRDNELPRVLSPEEVTILATIERYVDQSNLVQISSRMLSKAASLNDRTVRNGIESLLSKGCIAIHTPGTRNRAAIYMLNPAIATMGNSTAWVTEQNFWQLTGCTYELNKQNRMELKHASQPYYSWAELTGNRLFKAGTETVGTTEDKTIQKYGILRLAEKKAKKTAPSSGNDEAASSDGSD